MDKTYTPSHTFAILLMDCTWNVPGMDLECAWNMPGMDLELTLKWG